MNTNKIYSVLIALVMVAFATPVFSQARVQVIHNSADEAAEVVDVWLNDILLIDNFQFRTASPFIDAPAGIDFDVTIQPSNSTDTTNGLARFTYNLLEGSTYILVANGIVVPEGYNPPTPFDIYVYDMGREEASMESRTDILVHHGSTDAPTIDVVEVGVGYGTIVDDISYGEFDGYLELPTSDNYLLNLFEPENGTFATFAAPLDSLGLQGAAITLVASGFFNPENNNNGEELGLWVALASGGELVELPLIPQTPYAYFQIIHNSADAAAAVVDVWMDDYLLLDDFAFRNASFTYGVPAGETFTVSIKGPDSQNPNDPIWSMDYTLEEDKTYILVAEGIISPSGYNPSIPFDVAVYDMGQNFLANESGNTDVLVHHGSTDAPTVDIYETGVGLGEIVNDLMYADFAGYLELVTMDYVLEIRDETGMNTVAAFDAPLATLGLEGSAITVVASGFLNPGNNSNGPAFGLWVALPFGGPLLELPVHIPAARIQVIHNSADAAAEFVDVWLNDVLLIDDFQFRTASPFIDAPAGVDFDVTIQPANSTDTTNGLARFTYNLTDGETYILVANGIVVPNGYNPPTPFDIYVYGMGREMAMAEGNTDVLVFHGSTDAPVVDVVEVGVGAGTIVDNLAYSEFAGYLELPTDDYYLEIRDETATVTVASYSAPLETLGLSGQSLAIIASGFLSPENNNNGAAFALFVALASGGELIELGPTTSITEEVNMEEFQSNLFPNPARDIMNVQFELSAPADVQVQIFSMTGALVKSQQFSAERSGSQNQVIISDLPVGLYMVKMQSGTAQTIKKLSKVN